MKLSDIILIEKNDSCPAATQNLMLNTKNRDAAIKAEHIQYGPLNVSEPGSYWKDIAKYWNTTLEAAKLPKGSLTATNPEPPAAIAREAGEGP